jgi:hypothetical protein
VHGVGAQQTAVPAVGTGQHGSTAARRPRTGGPQHGTIRGQITVGARVAVVFVVALEATSARTAEVRAPVARTVLIDLMASVYPNRPVADTHHRGGDVDFGVAPFV